MKAFVIFLMFLMLFLAGYNAYLQQFGWTIIYFGMFIIHLFNLHVINKLE